MSKITIFLCAVLFAAAADATFLSSRLVVVQERVEAFVAAELENVDRIYEEAKKRLTNLGERLDTAADSFSDKVAEDIKKVQEKLREDIKLLVGGTKDLDLTECNKSEEHLRNIAEAVSSNMTECVVNKKETGLAYIENINLAVANVRANLTAVREESRRCGEKVDGLASSLRAVHCVKMAKVRGALAASRHVPALMVNIGKMTYLLSTLQPSLAFCTTTHGLGAFYRESRSIIRENKACIRKKIDEARVKPAE